MLQNQHFYVHLLQHLTRWWSLFYDKWLYILHNLEQIFFVCLIHRVTTITGPLLLMEQVFCWNLVSPTVPFKIVLQNIICCIQVVNHTKIILKEEKYQLGLCFTRNITIVPNDYSSWILLTEDLECYMKIIQGCTDVFKIQIISSEIKLFLSLISLKNPPSQNMFILNKHLLEIIWEKKYVQSCSMPSVTQNRVKHKRKGLKLTD